MNRNIRNFTAAALAVIFTACAVRFGAPSAYADCNCTETAAEYSAADENRTEAEASDSAGLMQNQEVPEQQSPQTNLPQAQQQISSDTGSEMPYFTAEPAGHCEDGVLTLADGTEWYKVKEFESGKDYLISVQDADGTPLLLTLYSGEGSTSLWRFFRRTIMPSTAPLFMSLTANGYTLRNRSGVPEAAAYSGTDYEVSWDTAGSLLHLCADGTDGYLRYDGAFSFASDPSEASAVTIFTQGETLARCITGQPHAEHYVLENSGYAAPVFTVSVGDAVTDSVTWYVDGVKQKEDSLRFTAKSLADQPAGVHRVSCLVEAHDDTGVHYRERSAEALFIIAKGVLPDSVLTFSDVHEQFDLIGSAIETVMRKNGGYIPALMLCTGDFVNDHNLGKEGLLNTLYPQIKAQLGGLDAVFVAGNHDSGEACAYLSDKAGLGDESGAVFCGKSDAAAERGTNSLLSRNVTVLGLHYDAALQNGTVSYARIMDRVEVFLQKTAAQYHGELVILSAHSGLHTVGSVGSYGYSLSWAGGNAYNPDGSYALAELINRYAEEYHMDILYIFGHNHSRGEREILLTDGDSMRCTVDSASQTSDTLTLHFTYANAGYLSDVIGSADRAFSLITREADRTVIELMRTDGETLRRTEIPTKYRPFAAPEQIAEMAKTDFAQKTGVSADAQIVQSDADCVTVRLYGADGNTLDTYTIDPATGTGTNAAGETVDLPQTGNADPAVLLFTGCALMLLTGGALCCRTALRRKRIRKVSLSQGIAAR